jgi:hypothetical protein
VLGAGARPLGVDDPRLGRELVGVSPQALGGSKGGGFFSAPSGSGAGAGVQRVEALATEDRAQGMDGKEETRRGGNPACPILRPGSPWHQTVHVAMGSEGLSPGVQDLEATELAPQMLAAALEQGLAGSPQEQREAGAFVGQDECLALMRERKDAVAIRHGPELGLAVCAPLRRGQGLTFGAVAIAA